MNKKFKNNINIQKIVGPEQRVEDIIENSDEKSTFLPKTILIEDIDAEIDRQFKEGNFILYLSDEGSERQLVPSFFLTNERWGEFSKTWKFMNEDKNVPPPLITITKDLKPKQGSYSGTKFSIPNRKLSTYIKVPFYENGRYGYDIYSIPQPAAIDLTYDIRLFTRYAVDVNSFIEMFTKNFNSLQFYININGHYFRCEQEENFDDESTVENVDGDRYYVTKQSITVRGYIQDANDFKVVKSYNRVVVNVKDQDTNTTIEKDII